jgi:hypothetical protein
MARERMTPARCTKRETGASLFKDRCVLMPTQFMTQWQPPKREPPKTKAELREMLTEAVRNTQAESKRRPKAKKDRA